MIKYPIEDYSKVKRDLELVRDLLLRIESDTALNGSSWVHLDTAELGMPERSEDEVGYHLTMLVEEEYVEGRTGIVTIPLISKLTWKGHEFLDNIRDPGIWEKTKKRVEGLHSVSITILAALAQAEIKKHLGLP